MSQASSQLLISLEDIAKIDAATPAEKYEALNYEEMMPPKSITPVVHDSTNNSIMIEAEEKFIKMYPNLKSYKSEPIKKQQDKNVEGVRQRPQATSICTSLEELEKYWEAKHKLNKEANPYRVKAKKTKNKRKAKAKKDRTE